MGESHSGRVELLSLQCAPEQLDRDLCAIPQPCALANEPGLLLSSRAWLAAGWTTCGFAAVVADDYHSGDRHPQPSLPCRRLAVVPGHAGTDDRSCASRQPRHGRSLRLRFVRGTIYRAVLGRSRLGAALAGCADPLACGNYCRPAVTGVGHDPAAQLLD